MEESLIPIARYLETNSAPGSVIFAGDVGALGYFSKRSVCDYNGIVSPVNASVAADRNVAHPSTMQEGSADSAALDEDGFTKAIRNAEYRSLCAADYVLHRSSVPDALASFPHLVPVMSRPFGQLSISNPETAHYTLYRTVDTPDVAVR
jgi:hypothetical protein